MDLFFPVGKGLTDEMESVGFGLGEESYNFWLDREGYLVNYPGRSDVFLRPQDPPAYLNTPPATNKKITRIKVFTDYLGQEHIVFVRKNELCVVVGNGYSVLYTFVGDSEDEYYFPSLFIHESKLIIAHFGDPVMMWDGVEKVHPLGVHEIPQPPELRSHAAPGMKEPSWPWGPWVWAGCWWPQEKPISGPATNQNAGDEYIDGVYSVAGQFFDKYGNRGRISPPSNLQTVEFQEEQPGDAIDPPEPWDHTDFLISSWLPPMVEDHIMGIDLGRTANLNSSDPQGGDYAYDIHYKEKSFDNVTIGRFVHQVTDTTLMSFGEMDRTVGPPPQASIGCSWNLRIFLAGLDDENIVVWSDTSLFGQFRALQQFRAVAPVKAVIPIEDRVVIITETSTEVLYENEGSMAILEQDFANGSMYGRSFVDIGGSVFGLWNNGFGFYNGDKFEFVKTPYYIKDVYVDRRHHVHAAVKHNEWYILSLRTADAESDENNKLLLYNFATKAWYILNESIFDLAPWDNIFLGVDDSIYEMFKGAYTDTSALSVEGLLPKEIADVISKRSVIGLALLMEASSDQPVEVEISDMLGAEHTQTKNVPMPSTAAIGPSTMHAPVWDDPRTVLKYASQPAWNSPGDFWVQLPVAKPVTGFRHRFLIEFPEGHRVRVKGLKILFSDTDDTVQ